MSKNIYDYFSKVSSKLTAIVYKDVSISFGELKSKVEELSILLLKLRCNEKSIVAFLLEETPEIIIALLAVSKLNAKFFVINTKYPVSVIEDIISVLYPKVIIANPLLVAKLGHWTNSIKSFTNFSSNIYLLEMSDGKENIDEDVFSILFTSGTTQLPKGVFHKQEDFIFVGERCFSVWNIKVGEKLLSLMSLFSAAALGCVVIPAVCYGCTIVLPENRKPELLMRIIQEKQVNFVIGTPTNFIKLMATADNNVGLAIKFSRLRGTVAGAPIPEGFVKNVYSRLGIHLYPHYGMTELLAVTSVKEGGNDETVGQPLKDIKIKIDKNNEILVKTPAMTSGYVDGSSLPVDKENFFHTGDLGMVDTQGNLRIFGRKDDMIIRGGNNIFPSEIEKILINNPAVSSCAVIGMPDLIYGQKIIAFVKLREKRIRKEELKEFLLQYLPVYKIPDEFIFVDDIPRTESGKIKRYELRTLYSKLQK